MPPPKAQLVEEMFVQVASGSKTSDGVLTLAGVSPGTLYFSDRPERVVGHMTNEQFVEGWAMGEDNFAADPPNAVLSYIDAGENRPEGCVVVLSEPKIDTDSIRYSYQLLEGSLSQSSGACTLFIDPLGRPLSPVSVAGMRRRQRRRA
jgi:hypothetical protein